MSVAKGFRLSDDSTAKLDWNYVTKPDGTKSIIEEVNDIKQDFADLEDRVEVLEQGGGSGSGLTDDIKSALLQLANKVAYIDDDGADYYQDLYDALYAITAISLNTNSLSFSTLNSTQQLTATTTPTGGNVTWSSSDTSVATVSSSGLVTSIGYGSATITATSGSVSATCSVVVAQATLVSIDAVYTQSGTVRSTDSLDSLKDDLVVTATWSNSTTSTVADTDYTLSGTLTDGTSTITVSYGGKTDTFDVTVTGDVADYVTENMTVWLDGLRNSDNGTHVSNLTTWVDQSGNNNSFTNYGAVADSDCLVFDGNAYMLGTADNTMTQHGIYPMTAEIVVEIDDTSASQAIICGRGNQRYNYSTKSGGSFLFDYGLGTDKSFTITSGIHTYSTDGTNIYLDGVQVSSTGITISWNSSAEICIGGYKTNNVTYKFSGKIYCIREYTSALTAEQIASNAAIDRRRFG